MTMRFDAVLLITKILNHVRKEKERKLVTIFNQTSLRKVRIRHPQCRNGVLPALLVTRFDFCEIRRSHCHYLKKATAAGVSV